MRVLLLRSGFTSVDKRLSDPSEGLNLLHLRRNPPPERGNHLEWSLGRAAGYPACLPGLLLPEASVPRLPGALLFGSQPGRAKTRGATWRRGILLVTARRCGPRWRPSTTGCRCQYPPCWSSVFIGEFAPGGYLELSNNPLKPLHTNIPEGYSMIFFLDIKDIFVGYLRISCCFKHTYPVISNCNIPLFVFLY